MPSVRKSVWFPNSVTVNPFIPTVSAWPTAVAITYGQTLASSTLSGGTASVGGSFVWTVPGTSPAAGTPSESVTFTPSSTNYAPVTGSITLTVNQAAPSIAVATSGTPSVSGTPVTFTASVPGGDTNTVTFYNGGVSLGTRTPSGGMATLTTSSLPQGNDSITAQIAAGGNFSSATSPAIIQAVNAASPGIAVATSGTPSNHGQTVTFTATVSGGCTGTVTFYDGGSAIGTGAVNGTTATLATGSLAVGAHSITASLPAAGQCSAMTSNPINQAVNTLYDSGTVTLTVSNSGGAVFTSSTSYGQASTPESVAEALAGSDSSVNVTAVNDALYIEATGTGTGSDYSYAVSSSWNSIFTNPSFQGSPPSGALTGGAGSGGGQTPVYIYTVGYDLAGNVTSASDINLNGGSVMGAWTYAYDTLNRLVSGHNTATTPASIQYANMYGCWAYDSFGNRTANDPLWATACPAQESSLTPTDIQPNS
jgi:hypothetical protein